MSNAAHADSPPARPAARPPTPVPEPKPLRRRDGDGPCRRAGTRGRHHGSSGEGAGGASFLQRARGRRSHAATDVRRADQGFDLPAFHVVGGAFGGLLPGQPLTLTGMPLPRGAEEEPAGQGGGLPPSEAAGGLRVREEAERHPRTVQHPGRPGLGEGGPAALPDRRLRHRQVARTDRHRYGDRRGGHGGPLHDHVEPRQRARRGGRREEARPDAGPLRAR